MFMFLSCLKNSLQILMYFIIHLSSAFFFIITNENIKGSMIEPWGIPQNIFEAFKYTDLAPY